MFTLKKKVFLILVFLVVFLRLNQILFYVDFTYTLINAYVQIAFPSPPQKKHTDVPSMI